MPWSLADLPDQTGRTVLVTGANSGLGLATTRALAAAQATVLLGCRDAGRAAAAMDEVRRTIPDARLVHLPLDLASLASIRAAAAQVDTLHVLVNNAGIMAIPRRTTADGFEMQFGTNHLGHFALTNLLLPVLSRSADARVVTVSSLVHRWARDHLDDPQGERRYDKWATYGWSKLANLLFHEELTRRLAGGPVRPFAAHPGYAATNLQGVGPAMEGSRFGAALTSWSNALFATTPEEGALPQLRAAVDPTLSAGEYLGPSRFFEMWGPPGPAVRSARSRDAESARRLWDLSERLTGVTFGGAA